jgi:hypothetical protein
LQHPRNIFKHNHHYLVADFKTTLPPPSPHFAGASATGKKQAQHIFLRTEERQCISYVLLQFVKCSWSWS